MDQVSLSPLSCVAICGGTHGNELSGVYIVREMQKRKVGKAGSVSVTTVLTNPLAVDACRRYIDTDLNRCFTNALLSAPITDSTPFELRRAQELNALLGPKGSQEAVDLDNDFKLLRSGDPIFQSFSGETVKHEGEELYPFFVNECAYYEKKIAFHLAQKNTLIVPSISVKKD
ncbi:hypothetical protein PAMP_021142 [Pampus punctatissimus]